jgi:hypothetical protein
MMAYKPGEYVQAFLDGQLIATQTDATVPNASSPEAGGGAGIFSRASAGGEQATADFAQLVVETLGKP